MSDEELPDPQQDPAKSAPAVETKRGFVDWHQAGVLADRYLETILADWKNTGLLLIQAPLLAGMAVAVWSNVDQATTSLYFVMVLSALWLGCMNACREIVKERALFLREKMVNLNVASYLVSKIRVLFLVGVVQVVMYSLIVFKWIDVRVPIGWLIISLMFTMICGTCLGLLISASVRRSDYAVGIVPLVILPQILFSEFAIKKDNFKGFSEYVYMAMPSRWGYESVFEFAQTGSNQIQAAAYLLPLVGLSLVFLALAYPILRWQRY